MAVFASLGLNTAFLLTERCDVPSPCTCSSNRIHCNSKQLSTVPTFNLYGEHYDTFTIDLSNNQLTTIPDDAFYNFSSMNASRIYMYLQYNRISQIEINAFSGIEHVVTHLTLTNNNLAHIPLAFSSLTGVVFLDLQENPLITLDASVMIKLGRSLQTLYISFNNFSSFPTELHFLNKVWSLAISHIPFTRLNTNAFDGLESSLTKLILSDTKLEQIPAAICHLTNLKQLSVSSSHNLIDEASIFEECSHSMQSLTTLTLSSNHLKHFPRMCSLFPNLKALQLESNYLHAIESEVVQCYAFLQGLYLQYNNFVRIPASINKLSNLTALNFRYNKIQSIEDYDVFLLHQLSEIDVSLNPLSYVSPNAFKNNPLLTKVDFSHTQLDRIPTAIIHLSKLNSFYMSGRPIACSCSEMSYLKYWNVLLISTLPTCSTGEPVKTYIMSILPYCP